MRQRRSARLVPPLALSLLALALCLLASTPLRAQTFTNPLVTGAGDPYITYKNGMYYFLTTNISGIITIQASPSLATLGTAPPVSVYNTGGSFFESPELYQFNGLWYIYYTQGLYGIVVVESDTSNPLGTYHYKNTLTNNTYDGSLLIMPNGNLYLLGSTFGSIVIQPLSNPYTVGGAQTTLAVHDQPWELQAGNAIEGPNPFWHNGQLIILYTVGKYYESNYAAGALRYNGGDPANAASYSKLPGPLFSQDANAGVYAPGVPSAFASPDGMQVWFAYSDYNDTSGQDAHRTILAQQMHFDAANNPILDTPVPPGQPIPLPSGDPKGSLLTGAAFSLTNEAAGLNLEDPNSSGVSGALVQLNTPNGMGAQSWRLDAASLGVYSLYNIAGAQNLDDPGGSNALGTKLQFYTPDGATAQQWRFTLQGGFQSQGDGTYTLTNVAAGLNLDDPSGSNQPGTKLQLYTPNGATAQNFELYPAPDDQGLISGALYTLTSVAGGLNLDNPSGSKQAGTPLQLYYANNATAQDWRIDAVGDGVYTLTNLASGMLRLDDPSGSTQPGTQLQLYYDNTLPPQNWIIRRQPDGAYTLTNVAAGLNLNDPGGSNAPGTKLQLDAPDGATAQEWHIQLAPDTNGIVIGAHYTLTNEASGLALSVPGSSTNAFTQVDQEPNAGGANQQWRLDALGDGLYNGAYLYTLTNVNSGLRLDDPGGSNQEGTLLWQYYPNTATAQQYQLNRQGDGSYTLTNVAAGLNLDDPGGSHAVGTKVQLYHANGATAQNWQFGLVASDTTPPATTATPNPAAPNGGGGWYTGPVQVTLTVTDPHGAANVKATYYALDGAASQAYASPVSVSGDAVHTLTYHSIDQAGNAEAARTLTVKIDGTPPVTTATAATMPATANAAGSIQVTLTATDNLSGVAATYYTLDGGAQQTYTAGTPVTITGVGNHTLSYYSTDIAGNTELTHTLTITLTARVLHTFAPGLQMIAVTEDYSGVGFAGAWDAPAGQRLAVWNLSLPIPRYVYTPQSPADALRPGQGYWVQLAQTTRLFDTGTPATGGPIPLVSGWNMIGNPFASAVSPSAVLVKDVAGHQFTFAQANAQALVYSTLYTWPVGATRYQTQGPGGTLLPYQGYWLYAFRPCSLLIPAPAGGQAVRRR
ncbi:MAG: RICIN domain-containing protein [Armatimonadetes bacterium]|nr:RICIN domain-containing protein [Armatimonadota bacterium]